MRFGWNPGTSLACVLLMLTATSAAAQDNDSEPEIALPESPNGLPMESFWDYAPEAPGGNLATTGPYYVSRWGNIVVRGRPVDGKVDFALTLVQCGRPQDPATQVTMIGPPPDGLCRGVKALPQGTSNSVSGDTFNLYGTSTGWTVMDFAQTIGGLHSNNGIRPYDEDIDGKWGLTSLGAVFHAENGKYVIYAPGETVTLPHGISFVVKPVMDEQELDAVVIGDALRGFGNNPSLDNIGAKKERPPIWAFIILFGVPLALIGGAIYAIRGRLRRRKQFTGALPSEVCQEPLDPE